MTDEQGRFCAKLLADLGATVIRIIDPWGKSARSVPGFRSRGKIDLEIAIDLQDRMGKIAFHQLLRTADVLVENFPPGLLDAMALGYNQLQRINPRIIHLSITGFGQTGPKSAYRACDFVCAAYGGQMSTPGARAGKPRKLFGPQSYYVASLYGANSILLNLRKRRITGKGCHIDLSIQEAVASTLDPVLVDGFKSGRTASRKDDGPAREPFNILRCKDGYIQIPILRNWETIRELVETDARANNLLTRRLNRRANSEKCSSMLLNAAQAWTLNHTKHELFELGQAMGFPWAPIELPEDVPQSPQLKAHKFYRRTKLSGHSTLIPGLPYRLREGLGKPAAVQNDIEFLQRTTGSGVILRRIRVLDLTRMVAGPFATRILGDFGAEVIKLQSGLTASGMERNDTPVFRAWNRNKRSVCLNLNRPEARNLFMELVAVSDVVVENYSPRVLANWGLTYNRLKAVKPDLIMASISAMGQTGPWKNYVGFAPTFHALSGLIAATSRRLNKPLDISFAYGDMIAGLYASLLILAAIENRQRTGHGQYIDRSAYEALCTLMAPASDEYDLAAPCGCYPCQGNNQWCVIAVSSEEEWQVFCRILNRPELTASRFSTIAGRRENRSALDRLIDRWTAERRAEAIVHRLQQAGIASGVVQNAAELTRDRQLAARRFFIQLKHPAYGRFISDRSALWPWHEKTDHWRASRLLGEDNHYVFVELLGHSERELHDLKQRGIVA
jgi:crotonobetainyl-CoA:carnitine CoA-transferase CaiB-like acyl-CoA transferase